MRDAERTDEFYVGYLPMPLRLRRWVRGFVVCAMLSMTAAALLVASQQRDPGTAVWDIDEPNLFQGRLIIKPYPMLLHADDPDKGLLIVAEGKFGAMQRLAELNLAQVSLQGTLLQRDGWQMIELADGHYAIQTLAQSNPVHHTQIRDSGDATVTLYGQIIDPKCYLGAMKPGEGKTHKACATLCIRGGIPPMFLQYDNNGPAKYYLLADSMGEALVGEQFERVLPFVADDVQLSGRLSQLGEWFVLYLDIDSIQRR